jgi:molybdate transport system permease protein
LPPLRCGGVALSRTDHVTTLRVPLADPASSFLGLSAPLWQALWLTLRLAAITTVVLGIVGLPLAQWLNTTRWRLAPAIETLVALPIVLPPTVIGFYLLIAFSPGHAPGSWWSGTMGAPLAFSFTGLVIASVFYSLPFAVQPFQAALRGVPRELLDAGTALGARPARVFLRLHAPLAWRGIAAGLTLGFAHTLGEFGVVLMIGGAIPGVTKVASIALYDEVQALAYPQAHAFAATLLGLSFVLLLGVTLLQRRRA